LTRLGRSWWVLLALFPGGGSASLFYAGVRARVRVWWAAGLCYFVVLLLGISFDAYDVLGRGNGGVGPGLVEFVWIASFLHTVLVWPRFLQVAYPPRTAAFVVAEERLRSREYALRLARSDSARAKALGVGRPDLQDAFDGGVVDINSAPSEVIERLPGIDPALAARVVHMRDEIGGFSSIDDLGLVLDLPIEIIDGVRDQTVFLPRR
jgi:DNA uptake protein ComE-like DNA-binding protein